MTPDTMNDYDTSSVDMEAVNVETNEQTFLDDRDTNTVKNIITRNNRVRNWLGRFIIALFVAGVVGVTYVMLANQERDNFRTAFEQFARTVGDAAIKRQNDLEISIQGLSAAISVHAMSNSKENWPYVTLPEFESFAQDYKAVSRAEFVGINNVVLHDERDAMVAYTTKHYQDWIKGGHLLAHGNLDGLNQDPNNYRPYVSLKLANGTWTEDIERDVYYVRTTQSPPNAAYGPLVNWNMASTFNEKITESTVLLRYETLFSQVRPFKAMSKKEHAGFHTDDDADHPHTFVFRPVYERVRDPTSRIVAVINSAIAWDASMLNLLPVNVIGILAVIRNTCNQSYTYRIDGHDAVYLGEGDQHSDKYDDMEVVVNLAGHHTHPDFDSTPNHCVYSMSVFPTSSFEVGYNTKTPETFAVIVAATFFTVAILFLIYDYILERRNKQMEESAARSNAVVDSLFPSSFKEKVLDQHHDKSSQNKPNKSWALNGSTAKESDTVSKPLAELYPATTVLFADIAGFTAWSSSRAPTEVFELLETIYGAFDKIANQRCVFKIETIGDCYAAVTGVPTTQDDHAIRMARFARDCITKMNSLMGELAASLGPETLKLSMRVGMHSGPVTGGVLRGEKSRFQLFGDTMNTASRVESNGLPGRIHVSESTANEIRAHGKGAWLTVREEKITAKGKGEMQTYWVSNTAGAASSFTALTNSSSDTPQGTTVNDTASAELAPTRGGKANSQAFAIGE